MATSLNELMQGFKNSFLFKGKTAKRVVGPKKSQLMESIAEPMSTSSKKSGDGKEGAFFAGSREWSDGKAEWYEICPPIKHRMPDGSVDEFDHVLIAHVDGKTMAYASCMSGHVYNFTDRELYSKEGDVSNEKVLDILGYSFEGDAETVVVSKEEGLKSAKKYEKYEDGKSETPESETPESYTPESEDESYTPESEDSDSPEPEDD